jgi:hypothetical protein
MSLHSRILAHIALHDVLVSPDGLLGAMGRLFVERLGAWKHVAE